jgi:uncharacterized protein with FMN-binding domain
MSAISLAVVGLGLKVSTKPAEDRTTAAVQPVPSATPAGRRTSRPPKAPRTTSPTSPTAPTAPTVPARLTVNGSLVDTPYGPVQVQLRIRGGRIVAAKALVRPRGDSQTDSINGRAVPVLDQEVVQAQKAGIDTVSGATYTSTGYRTSLQAALDSAHQAGAR